MIFVLVLKKERKKKQTFATSLLRQQNRREGRIRGRKHVVES